MKSLIIGVLSMILLSKASFSQTTLTEYVYITKGLIDDLGKGKDIKDGYKMEKIGIDGAVEFQGYPKIKRTATLYYFKKAATNKRVAIIIECVDTKNNVSYKCLPTTDAPKEVWDAAFKEFTNVDWGPVFAWAFSKFISQKLL